jgi:small subunit ribosomal protein S1
MVKTIDGENRRVSLSIRDTEGDPWAEVPEKYPIGRSVTGVVEKKENFGYFITIEPGVTGLLPKSKIGQATDLKVYDSLKIGSSIAVVVDSVDRQNRKVTLAPGHGDAVEDWQKYAGGPPTTLSPLGEKLKVALSGKRKK